LKPKSQFLLGTQATPPPLKSRMIASTVRPHKKNKKRRRESAPSATTTTGRQLGDDEEHGRPAEPSRAPKQISNGLKGLRFMLRKGGSEASKTPSLPIAIPASAALRHHRSGAEKLAIFVPHLNTPQSSLALENVPNCLTAGDSDSLAELRIRQGLSAEASTRRSYFGSLPVKASLSPGDEDDAFTITEKKRKKKKYRKSIP